MEENTSMTITHIPDDDILIEIPEPVDQDLNDSFMSNKNFRPIKLDFTRKFAKIYGRISRPDLEEFLLQKITESMIFRTKYSDIRIKLDNCEEVIERQKNRIELLEKQYADLEITHQRIIQSLRENPQAPVEPLKIVRSVSCQVYQSPTEYVNSVPIPTVTVPSPSPEKKKKSGKKKSKNGAKRGRKPKNYNDEEKGKDSEVKNADVLEITIDSSDDDGGSGNRTVIGKENDKKMSNKVKENDNSEKANIGKTKEQKRSSQSHEKRLENESKVSNFLQNVPKCQELSSSNQTISSKSQTNNSKTEYNSSKSHKNFTNSHQNSKCQVDSSSQDQEYIKRGLKRQAKTILEKLEKRQKKSTENSEPQISTTSFFNSSSKHQGSFSSSLKSQNAASNLFKILENSSKIRIHSSISDEILANNLQNSSELFKIPSSKTTKRSSSNSESHEIVEINDEVQKSNKAQDLNKSKDVDFRKSAKFEEPQKLSKLQPKNYKPGPMCSKLKQQNDKAKDTSKENFTKFLQPPPSINKNLINSTKKSTIFDQSFNDTMNISTYSMFKSSSSTFKSSANLITSTPMKALEKAPVHLVKRTLDMSFNEYDDKNLKNIPPLPVRPAQIMNSKLKGLTPAPTLKVEKIDNGIRITWRIDDYKSSEHADVESYQIFAYEETDEYPKNADCWRLVGNVNALLLPMAVTLREFSDDQKFYFAVRAVDIYKRFGDYSLPKSWA